MKPAEQLRRTVDRLKLLENTPEADRMYELIRAGLENNLRNPSVGSSGNGGSPFGQGVDPAVRYFWSMGGTIDYVEFGYNDRTVFKHIIVRESDFEHNSERGPISMEKYDGMSYYMLTPKPAGGDRRSTPTLTGKCVFSVMCRGVDQLKEAKGKKKPNGPPPVTAPPNLERALLTSYQTMRKIALESLLGEYDVQLKRSLDNTADYAILKDKETGRSQALVCGTSWKNNRYWFDNTVSRDLKKYDNSIRRANPPAPPQQDTNYDENHD